MKTKSAQTYFSILGISTNILNVDKGLLELPYLSGLTVAISDSSNTQNAAVQRFRDVSSKSQCLVVSSVDLVHAEGSTIVPSIGVRVPVFSVYAGRLEDTYGTSGHRITNNRLLTLQKEIEDLNSSKGRTKTPYLTWLCKAMGITRPKELGQLQDILIEAAKHPGSEAVPAIEQLLVGRGTRHAVMTVGPHVQYRDTEPVVNESDWIFYDLDRLLADGLTDTQASVIRKSSQAFDKVLKQMPQIVTGTAPREKTHIAELLAA